MSSHLRHLTYDRAAQALLHPDVDSAVEQMIVGLADEVPDSRPVFRAWFSDLREELLIPLRVIGDPVDAELTACLFIARLKANWIMINNHSNYLAMAGEVDMPLMYKAGAISLLLTAVESLLSTRDVEYVENTLQKFTVENLVEPSVTVSLGSIGHLFESLSETFFAGHKFEAQINGFADKVGSLELPPSTRATVDRMISGLRSGATVFSRVSQRIQKSLASLRMVPLANLESRLMSALEVLATNDRGASLKFYSADCGMATESFDPLADVVVAIFRARMTEAGRSDSPAPPVGERRGSLIDGGSAHQRRDPAALLAFNLSASYQGTDIVITLNDDGESAESVADTIAPRLEQLQTVINRFKAAGGAVELTATADNRPVWTFVVPVPISIISLLILRAGGNRYGWPVGNTLQMIAANQAVRHRVGAGETIEVRGRQVPLHTLGRLLDSAAPPAVPNAQNVILVSRSKHGLFAVEVDCVERKVDLSLQALDTHAPDYVSGVGILDDGPPLLVINPDHLLSLTA